MTQIKIIICLLLVVASWSNHLLGQEKRNSITVTGSIAHYTGIEDFDVTPFEGYYTFPVSPGVELIYSRQIFPKVELCTGINLQRVHVASNVDISYDYLLRFKYNELSIPLLMRINFQLKAQNKWYFTLGAYRGRQLGIIAEIPLKGGWGKWNDLTTIAGYSNDHFFTDIYLDVGYSKTHSWGDLSIAPFFKYRANPTWLNTYQKNPNWGIKFNFSFKF